MSRPSFAANYVPMLAELKELVAALATALVILVGLAWFIGRTQRGDRPDSREPAPPARTDALHHAAFEEPASALRDTAARFQGPGTVERIFIATRAASSVRAVPEAEVLARRGLKGDRYCAGSGRWSESDNCEVTLIAQEDLDEITSTTGIRVQDGEHRRNLVTRNVHLPSLAGKRFRIGTAYFAYDRPRPPCQYIQQITEPGMVKALAFRSGICVRCFKSGVIRKDDRIVLLNVSVLDAIKARLGRRFGLSSSRS